GGGAGGNRGGSGRAGRGAIGPASNVGILCPGDAVPGADAGGATTRVRPRFPASVRPHAAAGRTVGELYPLRRRGARGTHPPERSPGGRGGGGGAERGAGAHGACGGGLPGCAGRGGDAGRARAADRGLAGRGGPSAPTTGRWSGG